MTDKSDKALSFINSDKFGSDNWVTLHTFLQNSLDIMTTIELYYLLVEKLDTDKESFFQYSNDNILVKNKQLIILDMISKSMILIESIMILFHSLSKGYKSVSNNMTFYDAGLIDTVINNISRYKYKSKFKWALGLPNLKYLSLTSEEKKLLISDFEAYEKHFSESLLKISNFYKKFRVIYGKTKHGLTLYTAIFNNQAIKILEDSLVYCLSRTNRQNGDISGGTRSGFSTEDSQTYKFYNILNVVTFKKELIDEIKVTLTLLKELSIFIVANNMAYAVNCGRGYLPCTITGERLSVLPFRNSNNTRESKLYESILKKNSSITYTPNIQSEINFSMNPEIIKYINENTVTEISFVIPQSTNKPLFDKVLDSLKKLKLKCNTKGPRSW